MNQIDNLSDFGKVALVNVAASVAPSVAGWKIEVGGLEHLSVAASVLWMEPMLDLMLEQLLVAASEL